MKSEVAWVAPQERQHIPSWVWLPPTKWWTRCPTGFRHPLEACKVAFAKSVGGQVFSILELAIVLAEFG